MDMDKLRNLDATDMRIAYYLGMDGNLSTGLARKLGISEGSVRRRLGRLTEEGLLRISALA